MSTSASMRSIAITSARITRNLSTHLARECYRGCGLKILELRGRIEHRVDLVRQRSCFLRCRRNVRERGLKPRRPKLDQIKSKVAEREADAVELPRERHAAFHELLERASLTAEKRKPSLAFG